ncbi:MAG TPA: hypothetical protein VFE37_01230 [Chloroflexota bacterium]|nr:hypothetical protein [Chloroflexota bacterium]
MWRLLLAAMMVGGLVFVGAQPAAAFDYEEPTVPTTFMMAVQPAAPTMAPAEGTIFFRLALEDVAAAAIVADPTGSGVSWLRTGMPGDEAAIPNDQWTEENGGRAVWNWAD